MRKVVSLVRVQCQAETAFILAQMIAHKVGIFGQINSLESQFPQPFATVDALQSRSS